MKKTETGYEVTVLSSVYEKYGRKLEIVEGVINYYKQ